MPLTSFKKWSAWREELDREQPALAQLWNPESNADEPFAMNVRSKNAMTNTKSGQTDFDPDAMFCHGSKNSKVVTRRTRGKGRRG